MFIPNVYKIGYKNQYGSILRINKELILYVNHVMKEYIFVLLHRVGEVGYKISHVLLFFTYHGFYYCLFRFLVLFLLFLYQSLLLTFSI
jgi:hypothetical protein